ncbi:MAG: FtsW/RodA/SpoVE family cell cycle protein [Clostridiales bacterium]|nr:FtsW/RodA/SpoVE family cell cycle protein [Clostridiales bacterium]
MSEVHVKRSNIPMILMMFAIVVFGLVILYSVSGPAGYAMANEKSSTYYLSRQIIFTVVGIALCLFISLLPVEWFKLPIFWAVAYIVSLVLVIATRLFGTDLNGARRWIKVTSSFYFQPSEVIKIALVIAFAGYRNWLTVQRNKGNFKAPTRSKQIMKDAFFDFVLPIGAAIVVDVFILFQPHTSCFGIVAFIVLMCAINAGIKFSSWLIGGLTILAVAAPLVIGFAVFNPDYIQRNFAHVYQRLDVFNATSGDETVEVSEDETRQVTNAHNALGSGGMWGRGMGNSRAKYSYVSEAQNDYIFSIYVEETGFVGGLILILMYMVMFGMCLMVIVRANSVFTRMIATGCTSIIMIQVILNLAVELQVIPSTGVTLPFVSYGGTAQICLLIAYGMILCVSRSGTSPKGLKERS